MKVTKIDFKKGKELYTNRDEVGPPFTDEVKELVFFDYLTPDVADKIFTHLHVHNNFLCGAAHYVKFHGNVLKKAFKKDDIIYFLTGDKNNPYQNIFFKVEE